MIKCLHCDLQYEVVWNNDGDEPPIIFCPRCASEELELGVEDEDF